VEKIRRIAIKKLDSSIMTTKTSAKPRKRRPRKPKFTAKHGTNAGYQQHWKRQEAACDACREAHRLYAAEQRENGGAKRRGPVAEHGTRSAYERERKAFRAGTGPEPCELCRAANRQRGAGSGPNVDTATPAAEAS
jgi:hypothetical protein